MRFISLRPLIGICFLNATRFSYKLIARGTIEEKILALQQKKRAIIKATLGGEETLADNLTWEEIQGLFE